MFDYYFATLFLIRHSATGVMPKGESQRELTRTDRRYTQNLEWRKPFGVLFLWQFKINVAGSSRSDKKESPNLFRFDP